MLKIFYRIWPWSSDFTRQSVIPAALNDLSDEVEAEAGLAVHEHLVGHLGIDEEVLALGVSLDHSPEDVVEHASLVKPVGL